MTTNTTIPFVPQSIVHINGDSFFAAIEQAKNKKYAGKVVVVVTAKGLILSVSNEAKQMGIAVTMSLSEIKKVFPTSIILVRKNIDYVTYIQKLEKVCYRYSENSESDTYRSYFINITGPHLKKKVIYKEIAISVMDDIRKSTGITLPVCLSTSKVLAHLGSHLPLVAKPIIITERNRAMTVQGFFVEDIYNIDGKTIAYLNRLRFYTASDLMKLPYDTACKVFQTPLIELWKELNGISVWHTKPTLTANSSSSKNKEISQPGISMTNVSIPSYHKDEQIKRKLTVPYLGKVS